MRSVKAGTGEDLLSRRQEYGPIDGYYDRQQTEKNRVKQALFNIVPPSEFESTGQDSLSAATVASGITALVLLAPLLDQDLVVAGRVVGPDRLMSGGQRGLREDD
jgi:hypothetical protein